MKFKYKNYFKLSSLIGILIFAISLVGSGWMSQVAYAWCDQNAGFGDRCLPENYQDLKDNRGVTLDEYTQMAHDCMSGNPSGFDFGSTDEGTCINAVSSCLQKSIDKDQCKNADNLATIAHCDEGKVDSVQACDRLRDMNVDAYNKAQKDIEDKAARDCSVQGSPTDQFDQIAACKKAVTDKCPAPNTDDVDFYDNDKNYGDYGFNDYRNCLDSAFKTGAKDDKECALRGGLWVGEDTGTGGNTVKKGCYNRESDLINRDACEKYNDGAYEFKEISPGHFECVSKNPPPPPADDKCNNIYNPNDPAKKAQFDACVECYNNPDQATVGKYQNDPNLKSACQTGSDLKNGTAAGPGGGYKSKNLKDCGEVKVNLLACGTEGGNVALQNLLKIGVIVLSMLVGAAALGGLAYASMQYARGSDNQQVVTEAKDRIRNIVIGLMLYGFIIAIINWLVPGGIL
jgi:hypothetical protein